MTLAPSVQNPEIGFKSNFIVSKFSHKTLNSVSEFAESDFSSKFAIKRKSVCTVQIVFHLGQNSKALRLAVFV
jgi:hypothetical protein